MTQAQRDIRRKLRILNYAREIGNVAQPCRFFGISREIFYRWEKGLMSEREKKPSQTIKPCPENPSIRVPAAIEEKILHLRTHYHLGQRRIAWYLERHHRMKVSSGGVCGVLKRHGLNRLPKNARRRTIITHRYEKQVPGHHIQVDVKLLTIQRPDGTPIKRFQYTAVDDATRIRALNIYDRHTQNNAIAFIDYVVCRFPFRIHTVRTDNRHEFQANFHWHLHNLGIQYLYQTADSMPEWESRAFALDGRAGILPAAYLQR